MSQSSEPSPILPGMSNITLFLLVGLIVISWLLTNRNEHFMPGNAILSDREYANDIREFSSYVGPYIGQIYLYLRAKYYDAAITGVGTVGPMFKPGSIGDPTLADPLLPIARAQIKAWIDNCKMQMRQKYGDAMMERMQPKWDLSYTQSANGVLQVLHNEGGRSATYLV